MLGKLVVFLGVAAFARGAVVPAVPAVAAVPARLEEFDAVPQYSFAYDVQDAVTGDSKAQYETRNGDLVQGSYSFIEADGTRRIVQYTADSINGFNAVVSREPVAALAAIASPVLPYTPAVAAAPVPAAPVGPAPAIPASGPDSDVEVVEARSGPLVSSAPTTREQQLRQQQERQLQQLQEIQRQQQEQHKQQLQQLQQQQQQQRQQQQRSRQQVNQQRQQQEDLSEEQPQPAQPRALPSPLPVPAIQKSQRVVGLPARLITSYTSYPSGYAYTAYSSPVAYASPLAYAPATTLV